ncbi:MAG: hypothetical protein R6X20_15220 [Phycisphaerae bacterium]
MPEVPSPSPPTPAPLRRGVLLLFHVALAAGLVLAPTLFADHHRFGGFELLFLVCLLHAFWVVTGVLGAPLTHLRTAANLLVWGLLALLLLQTFPLPLAPLAPESDGSAAEVLDLLIEPDRGGADREVGLHLARYARRPRAATGVLMLAAGAAGFFWLASSAAPGRKGARRVTWAVVVGLGLLAYWAVVSAVGSARAPPGSPRLAGPALILGGDSLVPALLAALPACLLVVLRHLGWMPRRRPARRESRWGWIDRAATVRTGIALVVTGLVSVALGAANVPPVILTVCVTLAVALVLGGYVMVGPDQLGLRRPVAVALGLALWVALGLWLGTLLVGPPQVEASADGLLETVLESLPVHRAAFGLGAGAISPRATFGHAGWPAGPGDDVDTDGFLLVLAEVGWVGLVLVLAAAVAFAVRIVRGGRKGRGPWPKTAVFAGLAALAANLLYFRFDASALLAPNVLALAGVLGLVAAWTAHGAHWHPDRGDELAESRWPLVAAAVGLLGALGLAEAEMLKVSEELFDSDKVLHFGTFAVVSLLLCYALGPKPTTRYLKSRLLLAVGATAGLGAMMEVGQATLTAGRAFEWLDMAANALGAVVMATLWWVVRRGQAAPVEGEG